MSCATCKAPGMHVANRCLSDIALLVIREARSLAQFALGALDKALGR